MDETFTIDELTARTSVPTRTIRQYQTAGLLAPPARRGRVGIYGPAHVERLAAIGRLQERGYSLAGMSDLFDSWERGRPLKQIIGGTATHPDAPIDEAPLLVTSDQLHELLPALTEKRLRKAALRAGLITATKGDVADCWMVCAPSAIAIVADLIDAGVPAADAIALHAEMHESLDKVGAHIAETLATIKSAPRRVDLLQRNRASLGRSVASILISAIGRALPASDAAQVRVGSIRDTRTE